MIRDTVLLPSFFFSFLVSHPERVVVRLGDLPEPFLLRVHPVAVNTVVFVVPIDVSLCLLAVGALVCKGSDVKRTTATGGGGSQGVVHYCVDAVKSRARRTMLRAVAGATPVSSKFVNIACDSRRDCGVAVVLLFPLFWGFVLVMTHPGGAITTANLRKGVSEPIFRGLCFIRFVFVCVEGAGFITGTMFF